MRQPEFGYRAGIDPVLLAAAVPARPGDNVLDLGCGVGTAALCLGARVSGLSLWGLEVQSDYAQLAELNAAENGIELAVVRGDVLEMPAFLKKMTFDHVIANPPFFDSRARTSAQDRGREAALATRPETGAWCDAALRRLRPGGVFTVIQTPEALPPILAALDDRASVVVRPLLPRTGAPAHRIIVSAQKGGRAGMVLETPAILHEGARHSGDGDSYLPEISAILRDGKSWHWLRS